jgi:hypothetical protein
MEFFAMNLVVTIKFILNTFLITLLINLTGCISANHSQNSSESAEMLKISQKQLPPDQAKEFLSDMAKNWFYGDGLGKTSMTLGTILAFPPYGLYVATNSVLELAGYEPMYLTNLLPQEEKNEYDFFYSAIASQPGKLAASVTGEEYRSPKVVNQRILRFSN